MTIAGTCPKPDVQQSVPAGDKDGHTFTLEQGKCTAEGKIGSAAAKDGVYATHGDATATRSKASGIYAETMDSGDKVFYTYTETIVLKDGAPQSGSNTYQIAGGTGKMKGIKGSGTCKLTPTGDGGLKYSCVGTYTMGAAQ
jgi:hypothetical protein